MKIYGNRGRGRLETEVHGALLALFIMVDIIKWARYRIDFRRLIGRQRQALAELAPVKRFPRELCLTKQHYSHEPCILPSPILY